MKSYQERAFSIAAKYDSQEDLFWSADFSIVGVMCSDFFAWACADFEAVESEEDADALEQAYKDVVEITRSHYLTTWAAELYVARKRKLKPGRFVNFSDDMVKALFDAIEDARYAE